jgi:hypothetical protein
MKNKLKQSYFNDRYLMSEACESYDRCYLSAGHQAERFDHPNDPKRGWPEDRREGEGKNRQPRQLPGIGMPRKLNIWEICLSFIFLEKTNLFLIV